jgi:hypothetical protein
MEILLLSNVAVSKREEGRKERRRRGGKTLHTGGNEKRNR